jgi:hypothetical protein
MQAIVQYNRQHILAAAAAAQSGCPANKQQQQQQQHPAVLIVGYVMKASREEQLASAGLLPLLPGDDGLCFMPFDVSQLSTTDTADDSATAQLEQQQQQQQQQGQGHIDMLLHKGSDELVSGPDGAVGWSARLLALQQWLQQEQQRHICVVDPFENTAKVCFNVAADSCVHACVLQQQDQAGSSDLSRHLCMRRHVPAIHMCSLADMVLLLHPYAYTCCS